MLPLHTQLGIAFVVIVGVLFLILVFQNAPEIFEEDPEDGARYQLEDHDGVWYSCSRAEWVAAKTESAPVVRRSRLLPPVQRF